MIDKAKILGLTKMATRRVAVPEWDDEVIVKAMTALERLEFERYIRRTPEHLRGALVAFCVVDEADTLIFEPNDIPQLMTLHWNAVQRVSDAALLLNAVSQAGVEAARENFTNSPRDDLPTG